MNFKIPDGLGDMLREFTVSAIRTNPDDLYDYAVEYFTKEREKKKNNVPLYIVVDEDADTDEAEPGSAEPNVLRRVNSEERFDRRMSVSAERYDPEEDDDDSDTIIYPKTEQQRKRLSEAVSDILIFRALDKDQIGNVIDAMFEKICEPNDVIIKQKDDGDNFYVIDSGSFDVYVNIQGVDKKVRTFAGKGSFGELALMYNMPRSATIKATTSGALWAMDRASFRRIVMRAAFKKRKLYEKLIDNVPILKSLESYERMNLADSLSSKEFQDGHIIISQGDEADGMYFIEKGTMCVDIKNKAGNKVKTVSQLKNGQYFGELALINNKPRSASIRAVGDVKVAFLERESFERLLGPCLEIMKRNMEVYKTYSKH